MNKTIEGKHLFLAIFLLGFFSNFGISIISPLMGIIRAHLDTTIIWMALIFGLFPIFRAIASPICGKFAEKFSMKKMLLGSMLVYTILSFLYMIGNTVVSLSIIRIIQGISAGFILPIALTYISIIPNKKEGLGTTIKVIIATMLGLAFGPLVGGVIYDVFGYYGVFIVMGLIETCGILVVVYWIPEYKQPKGKQEEVILVRKTFIELLAHNLTRITLLFQFIALCQMTMLLSYLAIYVHDSKIHLTTSQVGIILFCMIIAMAIVLYPISLLTDKLSKNFKHLYLMVVGMTITTITMFLFPFCTNFSSILTIAILLGIGTGLINPPTISNIEYIGKLHGVVFWWSILSMVNAIAYFIAPLIAAIIVTYIGMNYVFVIFGVFGILTILIGGFQVQRRVNGNIKW